MKFCPSVSYGKYHIAGLSGTSVSGNLASSLSLEARLVRAIREALNWSGRTERTWASLPPAAGTMAISSRAELSQMEDEQITRIKKERRLRREEEEEEDIRSGVSQIGPDDDSVWSWLRIECNKGLTTAG